MSRGRVRWVLAALVLGGLLIIPLGRMVRSLVMTRGGMATFTRVVAAANAQDLVGLRSLCTSRYLASDPIRPSPEGGVIGFPRNIHKNFQVWTEQDQVWLCPTNREGPVYRLVKQGDTWKYDGLVGLLKGGRVDPGELDRLE